jgi:hypothetical protein
MRPQLFDHVYVPFRVECNRNPHGWVVNIIGRGEDREVLIKYAQSQWVGANNMDLHDPEFCLEGGDVDSMSFDEFEEHKVSSQCEEF